MISLPEKLIFPVPFAGGEGSELTPIALEPIEDATDAAKVNFFDGFPSSYSSPHENGGNFVTRGQLNAIGNLASKNEYYRMCGGINTFDPVFADKIGGYPKDAILDYFDGVNLLKVISLVEDNKHDFRNGSFGGQWRKLGDNPYLDYVVLDSFDDFLITHNESGVTPIYIGTAKASGILSIKTTKLSILEDSGSSGGTFWFGSCFLGRVFEQSSNIIYPSATSTTVGNYNGFCIIPGLQSSLDPHIGTSTTVAAKPSSKAVFVSKGDIVVVCAQNGRQGGTASPYYDFRVSFEIIIS